jgi:hypothetical protein
VERHAFKNIDHILVVVNEAVDVVRGGGNPTTVTIVGNTPSLTAFNNSGIQMNLKMGIPKTLQSYIRNS